MITLLVTCVGGTMLSALVMEARRQSRFDLRIVGVDAGGAPIGAKLVDAFHVLPPGSSPGYLAALLEVVRRERVDVILPSSDEEAFALSRGLSQLAAAGARAVVSPPETLALIADKLATYRALERAGVPVPEYSVVTNVGELRDAVQQYGFPERTVVIKPAAARGGRGIHVLCGRDEPPAWLGRGRKESRHQVRVLSEDFLAAAITGTTLVMPCLDAPAYDVDVLAKAGKPVAVAVRERVNPAGIPFEGNLVREDGAITAYCRDIAAALSLDALHDIDLMTDKRGNARVLEVNPRPSGSMVASLVAGLPLVDLAIAQVLERDYPACQPLRDTEVILYSAAAAVPVARPPVVAKRAGAHD